MRIDPIHNTGRSVVAERFIITLKNKINKYMTSMSKNGYINKLNDLVDECNNTYHRAIKMKPIVVKSSAYFDFEIESIDKDPKVTVRYHTRISKYKNVFAKGYTPN